MSQEGQLFGFLRIWNPSLWNVNIKKDSTPILQVKWKGWTLIVAGTLLLDVKPTTFHPQNTRTFAFPLRMAISKHRCSAFPPTPALKNPPGLRFSWVQTAITCSTLSCATFALMILSLAPPRSLCQSFMPG